jgi:cell division transport system permease protein
VKIFRMLGRNIRDAFHSVVRNFSLSLASITCILITLLIVSISIILSAVVNNFTNNVKKDLTIVVFLDRDITEERTAEIKNELKAISNIDTIEFRSKTEIAKSMMEQYETYKDILKDYDEKDLPLQDTYLIKVKEVEKIGDTAKKIDTILNVESVQYGAGMVEQLVDIFQTVKYVSIGVVLALIIVTIFLISNTIKITIFSRRKEIEIMRLVGASNLNIKIPFLFEGLFLGLFGAIIPILATIYGYTALYDQLGGYISVKTIQLIKPTPFVYYVSIALLIISAIVGALGSAKAVKKHLKI